MAADFYWSGPDSMHRFSAAALGVLLASAPLCATAQTVTAPLGQAVRLPLRGPAADVVVGDPKVADVTVVSPTALFVLGRGFGATNLIVMDPLGRTLFNGKIVVPASDPSQVTIQRGRASTALLCAPTCNVPTAAAPAAPIEAPAAAAAAPAPAEAQAAATVSALIRSGT